MENTLTSPIKSDNPYDAFYQNLSQQISDVADTLNETSKEKYDKKIALIENAQDISTQEKLDAMDQCYDRRTQEAWQNILRIAGMTVVVIGLAVGSPVAVKSVKKLVA